MEQFQCVQVWHVLNEAKGKYFLVDIVGHEKSNNMTTVQVTHEKFQVCNDELLPYDPEKPQDIYELKFINSPEIIDWLERYGSTGGWVKLNSRVCLDFDHHSEEKRLQHINDLLVRFLVTLRKKQYICVANDIVHRSKSHTVHQAIIKAIALQSNLWPYALPLDKLSQIYSVFFSNCAIKFKAYIKETHIIKLAIIPYLLSSKDLFATISADRSKRVDFTGKIFEILEGSPRDMKRYFKIPQCHNPKKSLFTVSHLVDCLISLGLKIVQVDKIISLFALIMNINQAQMVRYRSQGKDVYKVKENSQIRQNLELILGIKLLDNLYSDLNQFPNESDRTIENIYLKQQIAMRMIWKEAILIVAQTINEKMINLKAEFTPDVRKLIFIQFPAVGQQFQQTVENHLLSKINNFIKEVALKIPPTTPAKDIHVEKPDSIFQKIKSNNTYDINKKILSDLKKEMVYQSALASGKFFRSFCQQKLRIGSKSPQEIKGQTCNILDEIDQLQQDSPLYHANFIVRSEMGTNSRPSASVLTALKESIDQKHKRQKKIIQKKLQSEFVDYEDDNALKQQPVQTNELDTIEIKLPIFKDRYQYCELMKEGKKSKQPIFNWLNNYFQGNQKTCKATRINDIEVVCLKQSLFNQLENERKGHIENINKIKAQVKRWQYRIKMLNGLNSFRVRMRLYSWLCRRTYSPMRAAMKGIRQRVATLRIQALINNNCWIKEEIWWRHFKKRQAIIILGGLSQKIKPRSYLQLKRDFIQNTRLSTRYQRSMQGIEILDNMTVKKILSYQYTFMIKLEFIRQQQYKKDSIFKIATTINRVKMLQLKESFTKIKNQKQPQIDTIPSNNNSKNNSPSRPPEEQRPQPSIYISQPLSQSKHNPQQAMQNNPVNPKSHEEHQYLNHSQNQYRSNAPSSVVGVQKSQSVYPITKDELYSLRDCPKFSFQSWYRQAIGFQKTKPVESEKRAGVPLLFKKPHQERPPNKEPQQELNVDVLIIQKVVVNPFYPYLIEHLQATNEAALQKLMSHQSSAIKQPLLKKYPVKNYPKVYQQTFNNILKIGKDKNTSKSKENLINQIVKPLKDSYFSEKNNVSNVFQGEPAIIVDYSWEHNIIKDEVFLQFIKQMMMNQQEESLRQLFSALQVITRYYYPSPQFLYAFLHYLKSLQSKNIVKLANCFTNTLSLAQAYQRYKGNYVNVLKQQIIPRQKESYHRLQSRVTQITAKQLNKYLTISMRLFNEQVFEYRVRNENISHFRRKVLKEINFLDYQDYFGIYYCRKRQAGMVMLNQTMKAVDFLNQYPQSDDENLCYVRLKYYFPFSLKEINKTRIMYLNSIIEERNLPWKKQDYEHIVALSMMFDEFEEYRITNYLKITNQVNQKDMDLTPIQHKYKQMINAKGQKIGELEYFKALKECNFIAAKSYRIKQALSPQTIPSYIIVKPLELCLYEGSDMKSSIHLKRVRSHYLEKSQIYLQIDYKGHEAGGMRSITLQGVEKVNQLYQDIAAYIGFIDEK